MGQFNLIVQHPKPKKAVNGCLDLDRRGVAMFFTGNGELGSTVVGQLERARVDFAAANGIMVSGFERIGDKIRYQEWWLVYANP